MAREKVRLPNQVRRANWRRPYPQMTDRVPTGFLGVIRKIRLHLPIRLRAHHFYGALVCSNRAICAQPKELAADNALVRQGKMRVYRQGQVRHIVVDTDGEVLPSFHRVQRIKHILDHCGCELLAAQPVPSAADLCRPSGSKQRRAHVQIQRFTECAGLLRAVKHSDPLRALRDSRQQRFCRERTEQANPHHTDFLPRPHECPRGFLRRLRARPHQHQHFLRVRHTRVGEQTHRAPRQRRDAVHRVLHDFRQGEVVWVRCFPPLKIHVRILTRPLLMRMLRVHGARPELLDLRPRQQSA